MKRSFSAIQDQISNRQQGNISNRRTPGRDSASDFLLRSYRTWPPPTYRHPQPRSHNPPHFRFSSVTSAFRTPFLPPTVHFAALAPSAPPHFQLEPSARVSNGSHSYERRCSPERPMEVVNSLLPGCGLWFSVVTYNVLAQGLIHKNPELYTQCPGEILDWNYRKHNLLRELVESDAEVICLQEVEEEHYSSWYKPQLAEKGYEGVYQKRTGKYSDGCAMFYKSGVLEPIGLKAVTFQKYCHPLNRDNVGLVVKFRWKRQFPNHDQATPTNGDHTFCVATTHLLFNPKAGEIKLAQVACLLADAHSVASDGAGDQTCPIVVCGDMNSIPVSPLISFLQEGRLNYQQLSAWDIAGYYRNIGSRKRRMPVPLIPSHLGIGADCRYHLEPGNSEPASSGSPSASKPTGSDNKFSPNSEPLPQSCNTPSRTIPSASPADGCSLSSPESFNSPPGDFSDDPEAGVITHPFNLRSAYDHAPNAHGRATTYHQAAFETVDYIMFAPVCDANGGKGLRLLSRKPIPRHETLKNLGPQPHEFLSSDHLLLQATFQLIH